MSGHDFDVLVVGSGFGGSVAALRAAEKGYRVGVLEAGRRFEPEDFARTSWDLRRFLFAPRLGCHGIQRLTLLRDVLVLSGAGVGGGSLVYANVLVEPSADVWEDRSWADELRPWFAEARRMLGVVPFPHETPSDGVLRAVGARLGVEDTFERVPVGVWFGADGVDPYFDGAGPPRNGCDLRGACMTGCRRGAKNTLDRNYLWLAERAGARIFPEHEAMGLRRDGERWLVETRRGGFRAREVVLAAGVLGTLKLLLRSGVGGARVGEGVRTNSEVIVGATAMRRGADFTRGVAITSAIHPDPETQIQVVRYGRGSNAMGLLGTLLPERPGVLPWLATLARNPAAAARMLWLRGWSERTVILLVMQTRASDMRVVLRRGRLTTRDSNAPGRIEVADAAARAAAEIVGGYAGGSLSEVLLGTPTTAHLLGGAGVGTVVDRFHRVLIEPSLHVVDGSSVSANLGANPSLTIAAQAERALGFWPPKGSEDARPLLRG